MSALRTDTAFRIRRVFVQSIVRRSLGIEEQPFTLAIAGYGTGKSHLALTLATLLREPSRARSRGHSHKIALRR